MEPTIEKLEAALYDLRDCPVKSAWPDEIVVALKNKTIDTIRDTLTQAIEIAKGEKVVVPRKITKEMYNAGKANSHGIDVANIYSAMITAAQEETQ